MIVAGIGCRKGVSMADVLAAIDAATAQPNAARRRITALATVAAKAEEKAIAQAARHLGLELIIIADQQLDETSSRQISHSPLSRVATGAASASEAAALAAAGPSSRLLRPRVAVGAVTCAIAVSGDDL